MQFIQNKANSSNWKVSRVDVGDDDDGDDGEEDIDAEMAAEMVYGNPIKKIIIHFKKLVSLENKIFWY